MAKKSKEITVGSRVYVVVENIYGAKHIVDIVVNTVKEIKDDAYVVSVAMPQFSNGRPYLDTVKKENTFAVKAHAKAAVDKVRAHVGDIISADGKAGLVVKTSGIYLYVVMDGAHSVWAHMMPNGHVRFDQSSVGEKLGGIRIISRGQGKKAK